MRLLLSGSQPSLSPDGTQLAYTVYKTKARPSTDITVRILNLKTGRIKSLPGLRAHTACCAQWSPDERRLLLSVFDEEVTTDSWHIALVDMLTGSLRILPRVAGCEYLSSWGPEGRSILCADLDSMVELDMGGKVLRRIAVRKRIGPYYLSSASRFSFSGDRKYLLFNAERWEERAGDEPFGPEGVFLWDFGTDKLSLLSPKELSAFAAQWLPSGHEVLFAAVRRDTFEPSLQRVRILDKVVTVVATNATEATYSPTAAAAPTGTPSVSLQGKRSLRGL